ncbi:uncharacterized protein H6S33_002711 [Morchella sextelata]|uniref:uncharacterized protein n=1 Tax=Morchella sextelata TaxID=1174677 RepID=UPI001D050C2A|nr:uncharacterized protein H6S33_002711 [Morchella sextelata]KAH0607677.1 hypothetical protein H6S33_002711 [Morchella sextelata]
MHRVTPKKLFRPAGQVRSGTATTAAAVAAKWQQQPEVMVECGNNNGGERERPHVMEGSSGESEGSVCARRE